MNPTRALLAALLLAPLAALHAQSAGLDLTSPNLVANPSFEEGTRGWVVPGTGHWSLSTNDVYSGRWAMKMNGNFDRCELSQEISVDPGQNYILEFWANAPVTGPYPDNGLFYKVTDPSGKELLLDRTGSPPFWFRGAYEGNGKEWKYNYAPFNSRGHERVVLRFLERAGKDHFLDEVSVRLAGRKTAKADAGLKPSSAIEVIPPVAAFGRYEKVELTIKVNRSYENPFDPEQVDLSAVMRSPSGRTVKVNGFWDGFDWKIRFADGEPGPWRCTVTLADSQGRSSCEGTFTIAPTEHRGFVRISPRDPRYLECDDGSAFFGIGNCEYARIDLSNLPKMKAHRMNFVNYSFNDLRLVNPADGYERYDLASARLLDHVLAQAEKHEVRFLFCLWFHSQIGKRMETVNPFYQVRTNGLAFYQDPLNWKYQEKYYRYFIARYAYSPSIAVWHLVSELDAATWDWVPKNDVKSWHRALDGYFKTHDPFRHPTSVSCCMTKDNFCFEDTDIVQNHNYDQLHGVQTPVGVAENTVRTVHEFLGRYPNKPYFIGEFGIHADAKVVRTNSAADVLLHHHNAIWAGLVSGAASIPLQWWRPGHPAYYAQNGFLGEFIRGIDFPAEGFEAATLATTLADGKVWGLKGKDLTLVWLQDTTPGERVSGAKLELSGIPAGEYAARWFDTWAGAWLENSRVRSTDGTLAIPCPDFQKDLALRLEKR